MYDILDVISVLNPFGTEITDVMPEPEPSFRPRMRMVPFSLTMYPDDILVFRADPVTDDEGDSKRNLPLVGEPYIASVQSKQIDRMQKDGRTVTTIIHAVATPSNVNLKPDDEIRWLDRKLTVEARTIPKGIGDVTWRTICVETK